MRLPDWPARLGRVLAASVGRPLIWGEHDCFTFAGQAAEALTGVDPTAPLHGRYHDYASGLRAARAQFGVAGLRGFGDRFYPRASVACALRGDWALVRTGEGWAMAIVDGAHLRGLRGHMVPLDEARLCWRVA